MLADLNTPAAIDTFRKLLTGVPSLEPRAVQETLPRTRNDLSKNGAKKKTGEDTHEIFLRAMFAGEPQPLVNGRSQIVVVLLEEARRPVGVASTSERVVVPPVEEDGGGFWDFGHVRVHGVKDVH